MEHAQLTLIAKLKSDNDKLRLENDGLRLKEATFDLAGHPTSDTTGGGDPGNNNNNNKLYHHQSPLDVGDGTATKHPPLPPHPHHQHHPPQHQWHHQHHSDESSKFTKSDCLQQQQASNRSPSSPVNFQSFIVNSMHGGNGGGGAPRAGGGGGGARLDFDGEDRRAGAAAASKHPPQRLLGEVAFQLEQRILAYVFQGQVTFYGFTVLNVKEKIAQVATRPFTGMLDEGYQRHLQGRHAELMDKLGAKAGYVPSSHPMFAQFIINSYGRLGCGETGDLDGLEAVRKALVGAAPSYVLRDMLVLLAALQYMAGKDGKPLFLW